MNRTPNHYFISGGTGALGREVLSRLLSEDPEAGITLLVRARDAGEAEERLKEIFRSHRELLESKGLERITAVPGDLVRDGLGLSNRDRRRLQDEVTHIIHSAATIKLGEDLEEAWSVNVKGTERMLDLARSCRRLRTFTHISTAYVAGDRRGVILEDELHTDHGFRNAYERCKLEAELRVRGAMADLPIVILRPSIIVGDSRDGHLGILSGIYPPLQRIVAGGLPVIPGDGAVPLDLVPVDFVAGIVVELTLRPRRFGATYHVVAGKGHEITARELVERFVAGLGENPTPPVRFSPALRRRLEERRSSGSGRGANRRFRAFFAYLSGAKHFDDSNLRHDLGPGFPPAPDVREYLPALMGYCRETGWGRAPVPDAPPLPAAAAA